MDLVEERFKAIKVVALFVTLTLFFSLIPISGFASHNNGNASISGKVTNSSGQPIAGIIVVAYDYDSWDEHEAVTDAQGNYSINGLSDDSYSVAFRDPQKNYVTEYYNNKQIIYNADQVVIAGGQSQSGIDAQLADSGSITGKVTDKNNAPLQNIYIIAYDSNWYSYYAITDANGDYTVGGLSQKNYTVEFQDYNFLYVSEYYNDVSIDNWFAANQVSVNEGQTTSGINAQLARGGSIAGKVTDQNNTPIKYIDINVYDYNGNYHSYAYTDENGNYAVNGLAQGSYALEFSDYDYTYITEYFDNKYSLATANPITVNEGQTTPGINAQLAWITPPNSSPLPGVPPSPPPPPAAVADNVGPRTYARASGARTVSKKKAPKYKKLYKTNKDKYRKTKNRSLKRRYKKLASKYLKFYRLAKKGTATAKIKFMAQDPPINGHAKITVKIQERAKSKLRAKKKAKYKKLYLKYRNLYRKTKNRTLKRRYKRAAAKYRKAYRKVKVVYYKTVKTVKNGWMRSRSWKTYKYTGKKGLYRFYVYATDTSGNKQQNIAKRAFRIK